jgi:ribonuclease HII
MKLMTKDISKMSFKEIKEIISEMDIRNKYNTEEFTDIIEMLLKDRRKNVYSLGEKLVKEKAKILTEINRVRDMYNFDKSFGDFKIIAGVDEVGRGPLAGPIVACAVVLDLNVLDEELILGLNDSKKINEKKRQQLAELIKEKALAYFISSRDSNDIDIKGISFCNNDIFLEACSSLSVRPELILSDGYTVKGIQLPNEAIVKGDTKSASIAAASIIAKVYRDSLMKEYSKKYPFYGFEENAGYGTAKHIDGIKNYGPCEVHRMSFLNNILDS